ncbi:hypothetical protein ACFLSQ_04990 [Bacteroidota bacterium]
MKTDKLNEEIEIELKNIAKVINFIKETQNEIGNNEPDVIQKAAVSQFVSEFYHGVENILKRLCKFYQIHLPTGNSSHLELLNMFSYNNDGNLPVIFDNEIYADFSAIRKFRHYIIHGYAFHIKWDIIKNNVASLDGLFNKFQTNINALLKSIG